MSNIITISKKSSLQDWLHEIGFFVGNHPAALGDCFIYKGIDSEIRDKFKSTLGGLTRTVKGLMPKQIEDKIESFNDLISSIVDDDKFQQCATMKKYKQIVMTGIGQAVGFILIRTHEEIRKYADLMEIREVLDATQKTRQSVYRASHKGEHGKEVIAAVEEDGHARNKTTLKTDRFRDMARYIMDRALIHNDMAALKLLQGIYIEHQNILLPPSGNVQITHEQHLLPHTN
jgi:hypothetical protein